MFDDVANACNTPDQTAVCELARDYHKTGISESEAWILWQFAVDVGYQQGGRFHPPGYDSYKGGYHMKINGHHINIW